MPNTNSLNITNQFATPWVATPVGNQGGRVRTANGNLELLAADIDANDDTVRLVSLPENVRLLGIWLGGDITDGGTDALWNVGLYDPGTSATSLGAIVVTAAADGEQIFASGVTFRAVRDIGATNLLAQDWVDADAKIAFYGDRLWELAEDTEHTFPYYEIVMTQTVTAASSQAGTLAWKVEYVID